MSSPVQQRSSGVQLVSAALLLLSLSGKKTNKTSQTDRCSDTLINADQQFRWDDDDESARKTAPSVGLLLSHCVCVCVQREREIMGVM